MRSSIWVPIFTFSFDILLDFDVVFLHAKFQDHSFCELNFTEGILRLSPVSLDFQNIRCEKRYDLVFTYNIVIE